MPIDLKNYTLTFSDKFTGSYLNTSIWGTKYWWGGRSLSSNGFESVRYAAASVTLSARLKRS